jgi:transposase
VHVKALDCQQMRTVLHARQFLVDKVTAIENCMRASLRNFGLKMGQVTRRTFADRARELAADHVSLELIIESLLRVREALLTELRKIEKTLLDAARRDPVTRMLMTAPGVVAIVALTFRSAVDDPNRFSSVKSIGPWLGLTPRRYQSGQVDRVGHITKAGDASTRTVLYEAATTLLGRMTRWSSLKSWGVRMAARNGIKKARVAVARKLAVILLGMWKSNTPFRWSSPAVPA